VALLRRFSALSLASVMGLAASGVALALYYVESVRALLGNGLRAHGADQGGDLGGLSISAP